MCRVAVRPKSPKVEMSPISPKQWSPWRWEMKIWLRRENFSLERRSWSCAPSPQSIMNSFSRMFTTCDDAKCRVVGKADPQPNMFTSNFSIGCKDTKGMEIKKEALVKECFFLKICQVCRITSYLPTVASKQPKRRCRPK